MTVDNQNNSQSGSLFRSQTDYGNGNLFIISVNQPNNSQLDILNGGTYSNSVRISNNDRNDGNDNNKYGIIEKSLKNVDCSVCRFATRKDKFIVPYIYQFQTLSVSEVSFFPISHLF